MNRGIALKNLKREKNMSQSGIEKKQQAVFPDVIQGATVTAEQQAKQSKNWSRQKMWYVTEEEKALKGKLLNIKTSKTVIKTKGGKEQEKAVQGNIR